MSLTKEEIQQAIAAYTAVLERCVRACHNDGTADRPDYSVLNAVGEISKIRRDLIELRLMLREVEAEEDRKTNTAFLEKLAQARP